MKAFVLTRYGSPADLQLREVATPAPADDEVLVGVHAASVNDWDWGLVRGTPFYIRVFGGLFKPNTTIPGVDVAGRVEAIGKHVKTFQVGDEVYGDLSECGFGGFAEYVCAPERALAPKPAGVSFAEAAALPHAAMLALQGLRDVGHLRPGQTLLINGAGGGVGTLGIQIARAMGVEEVTGVDSASKQEMMRSLGYARTLDYRQEDFTRTGERYDLILDAKTTRSPFAYLRALNPDGRYVSVGGLTSRLLQTFLLGPLVRLFSTKRVGVLALKANKDLAYLNELVEAGSVKPVIDGPYVLAELPRALQRFGDGHHKGKVVITVQPDAA